MYVNAMGALFVVREIWFFYVSDDAAVLSYGYELVDELVYCSQPSPCPLPPFANEASHKVKDVALLLAVQPRLP